MLAINQEQPVVSIAFSLVIIINVTTITTAMLQTNVSFPFSLCGWVSDHGYHGAGDGGF